MYSTREPLPARTIERPVVLPKGWTELTERVEHGFARRGFDDDGRATPLEQRWSTWTATTTLRLGLAPGFELFAAVPVVHSRFRVDQLGFGTSVIGGRYGFHGDAPSRSVAVELAGRLPLGFTEGSLTQGALPTSTGNVDLTLAVLGRFGWNGLVLDGRIEGWQRFAERPAWTSSRFRPGRRLDTEGSVRIQAGPLVFGPHARGSLRERAHVDGAPTGVGGVTLALGGLVALELTRGVELFGVDASFGHLGEHGRAGDGTASDLIGRGGGDPFGS